MWSIKHNLNDNTKTFRSLHSPLDRMRCNWFRLNKVCFKLNVSYKQTQFRRIDLSIQQLHFPIAHRRTERFGNKLVASRRRCDAERNEQRIKWNVIFGNPNQILFPYRWLLCCFSRFWQLKFDFPQNVVWKWFNCSSQNIWISASRYPVFRSTRLRYFNKLKSHLAVDASCASFPLDIFRTSTASPLSISTTAAKYIT